MTDSFSSLNSPKMDTSHQAPSPFAGGDHSGSASPSSRGRMLTGMFRDRDSAEKAYNSVTSRGYRHDDVDLVMSDDTRKRHF